MAPCSTAHWISLTIHAFSISNSIPNGRQTWMLYVTIVISFKMIQDAMLFLVCQCVVGEWRSHPCCHWESKARIGRCRLGCREFMSDWGRLGKSMWLSCHRFFFIQGHILLSIIPTGFWPCFYDANWTLDEYPGAVSPWMGPFSLGIAVNGIGLLPCWRTIQPYKI